MYYDTDEDRLYYGRLFTYKDLRGFQQRVNKKCDWDKDYEGIWIYKNADK